MKKARIIEMCMILGALLATSCMTPKKLLYLQDMNDSTQVDLNQRYEARIAPSDRLGIFVSSYMSAKDAGLVDVFNQKRIYTASRSGIENYGYLVDAYGDIYFPVLGRLHVSGLTRLQLQDTLTRLLVDGGYLKDPLVSVEFSNFRINFIGGPEGGKVIYVDDDRCTLFEALALAGDLSVYSRRDKVKVIREVNGKMTCHTLDPRSTKIFNDPYFQLQQNDIVMTQSFRGQYYRRELSYWMSWVSAITSVSSLVTMILMLL